MKTNQTPQTLEQFKQETMQRAAEQGWFPAQYQREVDWFQVLVWAERVQNEDFAWKTGGSVDAIIVSAGPNGTKATHSGQHRILGGLMGGKEVPATVMTELSMTDPTRAWDAPIAGAFDWMK